MIWRSRELPATLTVGDPPVEVSVRPSARARRMTLRMASSTGGLSLTVPRGVPEQEVRHFLDRHCGWIAERLAGMTPLLSPGPGTVIHVGGRALRLAESTGRAIRRDGDTLHVPGTGAPFRARLKGYLREVARASSAECCDRHAAVLGRPYRRLTMRDPRSRWGSCTSTGDIMLSWRLILAPPDVLDYVAAHEVAHLAEMNHSPAFWKVVAALKPDYAVHRRWLRAHGATLHRTGF